VKGLRVSVKDPALKEKDWHLKVKAFLNSPYKGCHHKKRSVKELIEAAKAAFAVGKSWAFARRIRNRVKGPHVNVKDPPLKVKDCHLKVKAFPRFNLLRLSPQKRSVNELYTT